MKKIKVLGVELKRNPETSRSYTSWEGKVLGKKARIHADHMWTVGPKWHGCVGQFGVESFKLSEVISTLENYIWHKQFKWFRGTGGWGCIPREDVFLSISEGDHAAKKYYDNEDCLYFGTFKTLKEAKRILQESMKCLR